VEDKPSFLPDPNDDDDEQILDHSESKGEAQLTPKPSSPPPEVPPQPPPPPPVQLRRSERQSRPPERFRDFVM